MKIACNSPYARAGKLKRSTVCYTKRTQTIGVVFPFRNSFTSCQSQSCCVVPDQISAYSLCVPESRWNANCEMSSEHHCNFTGLLVFVPYELSAFSYFNGFLMWAKMKSKTTTMKKEKYENMKHVKEAKIFIVYWIELNWWFWKFVMNVATAVSMVKIILK